MDDMWDDDTWEENDQVPPVKMTNRGTDRRGFNQRSDGFDRRENNGYGRNFDRRDGGRNYRDEGRDNRRFDDNRFSAPRQERFADVDQNAEEFYISSMHVSMIIGRGGETIRGLQDKFHTRISIDKNTTELMMALVKITGKSADNITACAEHIKQLCKDDEEKHKPKEEEPELNVPRTEDGSIDYDALNRRCDEARRERWAKCPTLIKNFYRELPEVANMSAEVVQRFRTQNMNISVARTFPDQPGGDAPIPNPVTTFEQAFGDYPDLLEEIRKAGFTKPSPIQAQGWPVLLKGEDLIGIAQTGTGKTLAFLLPALIHTDQQPVGRDERGGANVLVMAPTRELALQIEKEVEKYQFRAIKACCLYGGGARNNQIKLVKDGVQIIIATPGRLNDLVAAGCLKIESITYLVLDEADRMLDMGFEPQIRKLLLDIRPDRQTVMTSATWPPGVRRLASSYMQNPIQVFVGSLDLAATHTVTQHVEIIEEDEKFNCVIDFIKTMTPTDKAIIFCGKKARADDLASDLALMNIPNQSIHGNREQSDREQALADIKDGTVRILVATDVASRGLDIEDITHVVNMDFPRNIEEYVHRVGRTGRAGRSGISLSFMTRSDWAVAAELISILNEAGQTVPTGLQDMADRFKAKREKQDEEKRAFGIGGGGGHGGRDGGFGGGGYGGRDGGFSNRGGGFGGRGRDSGGFGNRDGGSFGGNSFDTVSSTFVDQGRVGAVIGRGGSTIKSTQDKFNVKIDVDKSQGSRAKITVKGQSEGDVSAAIAFIEELVGRYN